MMDSWRPLKLRKDKPKASPQFESIDEHVSQFTHSNGRMLTNVKPGARQVPAGVGVAPRPVNSTPPPPPLNPKKHKSMKTSDSGELLQDFRFPQPTPSTILSTYSDQSDDHDRLSGQKFNMHNSYVADATPPRAPSKPKLFNRPFSPAERYSGSIYPESDFPNTPALHDENRSTPRSTLGSTFRLSENVKTSQHGKLIRPTMTTIHQSDGSLNGHDDALSSKRSSRTATWNALSAAVAAGLNSQPLLSKTPTPETPRSRTPVRMPFATESSPQSSIGRNEDIEPPELAHPVSSLKSNMQSMYSSRSTQSGRSLLGLGIDQPSMSNKIPANRRPPQLNMGAIKENGQRNSTTSLAELIKRATKLAANLDRGRTASAMDLFGNAARRNRDSTMSDYISAFPVPAIGGTPRSIGTPRLGTPRQESLWPMGEKLDWQHSNLSREHLRPAPPPRRRCCGLSLPVFIALLTTVVLIVAAAVLVPIFLVLVPKQHQNHVDLAQCASSYPCNNGGTSIVSNDACNCVCSGGFIGSHCDMLGSSTDCTTLTLTDGGTEYKNATMGSSVMPLFYDSQIKYDIPLNASTVLALFAANNLSCISENQLVEIDPGTLIKTSRKNKRFVMLPNLNANVPSEHVAPLPTRTKLTSEVKQTDVPPVVKIEARQGQASVGTSNGIVFQSATTTDSPTATIGTAVFTITSLTGLSGSATATTTVVSTSTAVPPAVKQKLDFAKVIVLYALEKSSTISLAVNAQQRLEEYFQNGTDIKTVNVGFGDFRMTANFEHYTIEDGDGTIVGGKTN